MFSDYVDTWLENALDTGLTEQQFWNMTLGELDRHFESFKRVQKRKQQEEASANYRLADLVAYSIARIYSKNAKYPEIYDVYPVIFDRDEFEEAKERNKNKQTFDWLKQFTESFNNSDTKEGKDNS